MNIAISEPGSRPPRLAYSIPALVEASSISKTTIYAAVKSGHLKLTRVGGRTIVLSEDAYAWLRGDTASNLQVAA
jgi:hypothetical protein